MDEIKHGFGKPKQMTKGEFEKEYEIAFNSKIEDREVKIIEKMIENKPKAKRGFASMTPERLAEVARKGGLAMPSEKRAYSKDRELAANAGRKGGLAGRKKND